MQNISDTNWKKTCCLPIYVYTVVRNNTVTDTCTQISLLLKQIKQINTNMTDLNSLKHLKPKTKQISHIWPLKSNNINAYVLHTSYKHEILNSR